MTAPDWTSGPTWPALKGRHVLVTGASSGIGRATCLEFARQGAAVVVHYNRGAERAGAVAEAVRRLGADARTEQADLGEVEAAEELAKRIAKMDGRLDILVNNAGDPIQRLPFADISAEVFDRAIAVNLRGPFILTRALVGLLKESRGTIVNVSSDIVARGSAGDNLPYAISKGGLETFTRGLAVELAPFGIRVCGIRPGLTNTELHRRLSTPGRLERQVQRLLIQRMADPREVAAAIVFLASDAASYITGEVLNVDGGNL